MEVVSRADDDRPQHHQGIVGTPRADKLNPIKPSDEPQGDHNLGPDASSSGTINAYPHNNEVQSMPPTLGRLSRMRQKYNLEDGKIKCRCLVRKWKFCQHIKLQAGDNKSNHSMLRSLTLREVQSMHEPLAPIEGGGGARTLYS